MFKIKQYIKNNKQLLIIFLGLLGFLFLHNIAYCDLSFFQKWYQNTENYFLNLTWQKAISDPIEISKGLGWVSVGAIGSLYAFEWIWNGRLLFSKGLYYCTPLGYADDTGAWLLSWVPFLNIKGTSGILKHTIDTVAYEQILPLYLARNYVFPHIFVQPKPNKASSCEINTDTNSTTANNSLIIRPNVPEITSINNVEPQIVERIREVDHYFEVPVYINQYVPVVEYRDRENLLVLGEKIDKLAFVTNESNLAHIGLHNGYAQLKEEIPKLIESNKKKSLNLTKIAFYGEDSLGIYYEYSNGTHVTVTKTDFPYPFLLTMFETFVEYNQTKYGFFRPEEQETMYNCPTIELSYSDATLFNSSQLQLDKTMVSRIFCQDNMLLFDQGVNFFMTNNVHLQRIQTEQQQLACELRQKINEGLLSKELTHQSTQTMDFSINDMFFDEINSYLEIQDQSSFIVASRDGQNLPFNELNEANTQAGLEMMKKYKESKIVKKQALKEQEALLQAEPLIQEGVNTASSNLFQNMATLFSVVLVGAVVHDPQTVDVLAKTLLGFTHLPEYNQAFLAATHMSIADLQMEYNFGPEEARRAYDAIGQAYDIRHPGSSLSDISSNLSNSNDYLDQAQKMSNSWGWKDYLLFTGGIVIACGTLYYVYQSVKTGTPVENIQNISPNVEVWKNAYFEKINKL